MNTHSTSLRELIKGVVWLLAMLHFLSVSLYAQPTILNGDHEIVPDLDDNGSLSVSGTISAAEAHIRERLDMGTTTDSFDTEVAAIYFDYEESLGLWFSISSELDDMEYLWFDNLTGGLGGDKKMSLGANNLLTLYNSSGAPVIQLDPGAGTISINGSEVLVQGSGSAAYLNQGDLDSRYIQLAAPIGLFGGIATHAGSLILGDGNASQLENQVVFGTYGEVTSDTLFSIGNGVSGSPSNAFHATTGGDVTVGRDLHVARNADISGNVALHGDTTMQGNATVNGVLRIAPAGDLSMGQFGSYDQDAQNYFDQVLQVSGKHLGLQGKAVINSLVLNLKSAGAWDNSACWLLREHLNTGTNTVLALGGKSNIRTYDGTLAGSTLPQWSDQGMVFQRSIKNHVSLNTSIIISGNASRSLIAIYSSLESGGGFTAIIFAAGHHNNNLAGSNFGLNAVGGLDTYGSPYGAPATQVPQNGSFHYVQHWHDALINGGTRYGFKNNESVGAFPQTLQTGASVARIGCGTPNYSSGSSSTVAFVLYSSQALSQSLYDAIVTSGLAEGLNIP